MSDCIIHTWYLATNLPRPGSPLAVDSPVPAADIAEVARLYGLRNWVEQSYKQVKHELGWADFMVRADEAIRRHWQLVCCAFSFCWWAWHTGQNAIVAPEAQSKSNPPDRADMPEVGESAIAPSVVSTLGRGENLGQKRSHVSHRPLASRITTGAGLAGPMDFPLALLAGVVQCAPASGTSSLA
jgi:hypothetical protein